MSGFNLEANRKNEYQATVRYTFGNARGLTNNAFRRVYFNAMHRESDIFICAKTGCTSTVEEYRWQRDWPDCSFAAWASSKSGGSCARGMAIFISNNIPTTNPKVLHRDPHGRSIVIQVEIHGRTTVIIGFHADNSAAAAKRHGLKTADDAQEASILRLRDALGMSSDPLDTDKWPSQIPREADILFAADCNNVLDSNADYLRVDRTGPDLLTPNNFRKGKLALSSLLADLGNLCDAFRHIHPFKRSFTRINEVRGKIISKARIDRTFVKPSMATEGRVAIIACEHINATNADIEALREAQHLTENDPEPTWTDHAAVKTTIKYSNHSKAPHQWSLPHYLLKDPAHVDHLRKMIDHAVTSPRETQIATLTHLLDSIKKWANETKKRDRKHLAARRHQLEQELTRLNNHLGKGFNAAHDINDDNDPGADERRQNFEHKRENTF